MSFIFHNPVLVLGFFFLLPEYMYWNFVDIILQQSLISPESLSPVKILKFKILKIIGLHSRVSNNKFELSDVKICNCNCEFVCRYFSKNICMLLNSLYLCWMTLKLNCTVKFETNYSYVGEMYSAYILTLRSSRTCETFQEYETTRNINFYKVFEQFMSHPSHFKCYLQLFHTHGINSTSIRNNQWLDMVWGFKFWG